MAPFPQAAWNVRGTFLADIGEPEQSEEMLRKAEALFLTADRAQAAGEPSPSALEGAAAA